MRLTLAPVTPRGNEPGPRSLEHTFWNFMMCCNSTGAARAGRACLLVCAFLGGSAAYAEDWPLSAQDLARLDHREVLLPAPTEGNQTDGKFRSAIEIDASAERIFRTMTDCAQALKFVPHLIHCQVLETAADGSWQTVEHQVNYGWYLPRATYVFRAAYEPFDRISYTGVRGDFREIDGIWDFSPRRNGAATIVTYRARVALRFFVPRWILLASLKHDLPALMRGLRERCESP
jgi:ribosome-associated toxin RatA of RatAB toxin-antitoxin module